MNNDTDAAAAHQDEQSNVAAYLPEMARLQPDALAVAAADGHDSNGKIRYRKISCAELNRNSDRIAHGLESIGIGKGVRTVLMVKPGLEFFSLTFALFKTGAIPVLADPGMGIANLKQCLAEAEPEAFIGIPKAHLARILFRWAADALKIKLTVGPRIFWGGHTLAQLEKDAPDRPYRMPESGETAAILFTSGSTGVPKGVVYTHEMFAAQVRLIKKTYGILPGETDLSTFPLFALFGPALGMASVVPEMDASRPAAADPHKLLDAAQTFRCTNMFASPALINKIGRYCEAQGLTENLPTLRRVISAGAPASIQALERFSKLLAPDVEIFTPYGATEALPVSSIGSNDIFKNRNKTERGACVGRPVSEMEIAIIVISDDPVPAWSEALKVSPGQIGEIAVKGPVVSKCYYQREQSTILAKIRDPATGLIYHRMGDVGYIDEQGLLWMCGRKSHRVETEQGTMFTEPCEAVFNTHPQVFRSALTGVCKAGKIIPVICIELEKGVKADKNITRQLRELAKRYPHTENIEFFYYHPSFPVDVRHNAKIFREKLALWAARKLK
ncbi:MAG: AMP-binding protein [Gammaproteobacteria bacterium]|nr:AMP-binding protein [Gammaproteobacteria bacterium]